MKFSRREALAALAGATLLTGCSRVADTQRAVTRGPLAPPRPGDDPHVALLNRFGYGPSPEDLMRLREHGPDAWFEAQLKPSSEEPAHLAARLGGMEINHLAPMDMRDWPVTAIVGQMQQAAILRAVYSPWQLRERMVDFWSNHFNVYAKKGLAAFRKPHDERTVIRANALGSFPKMLMASAKSTAMLVYLDQQNSTSTAPNENYARELLELHTLGVDGGYTQQDVMEVARCFTGWTEERGFLRKKGAFVFRADIHDDGEKTVLGHTIPAGGGVQDGERVINILAKHPNTARNISRKLCEYFLGPVTANSPAEQTALAVAQTYLDTEGDIAAMMRVVYQAFPRAAGPVMKRPLDFVASALRALDATTDGGEAVQQALTEMGQPLYLWPMPDGYPIDAPAWTGSLLGRWNFAHALATGALAGEGLSGVIRGGTRVDWARISDALASGPAAAFLLPEAAPTVKALGQLTRAHDLPRQAALALSSPEYQWR